MPVLRGLLLIQPQRNTGARRIAPHCHTLLLQACFGHTEGAAGVTGMLMAMGCVADGQVPGIMCLRSINPYVSAAVSDWAATAGVAPLATRQTAAGVSCSDGRLAGGIALNISFRVGC